VRVCELALAVLSTWLYTRTITLSRSETTILSACSNGLKRGGSSEALLSLQVLGVWVVQEQMGVSSFVALF
jgi:hypothetical protein